jgi:hypothetical protein
MDEQNDVPGTEAMMATTTESPLSPCFGTAKDVVARYSHCVLCGANLHFTYVTDFAKNMTQESARCPECGVQARRSLHKLQ